MPAAAAISVVDTSAYGFSPNTVMAHCSNCSRRASGSSRRPRVVVTARACHARPELGLDRPRRVIGAGTRTAPAATDAEPARVVGHRERQLPALLVRQRRADGQPGERRPGGAALG